MVDFCASLYRDPDQRFLKWIWIRIRPNDTDPTGLYKHWYKPLPSGVRYAEASCLECVMWLFITKERNTQNASRTEGLVLLVRVYMSCSIINNFPFCQFCGFVILTWIGKSGSGFDSGSGSEENSNFFSSIKYMYIILKTMILFCYLLAYYLDTYINQKSDYF